MLYIPFEHAVLCGHYHHWPNRQKGHMHEPGHENLIK